VSGFLIYDASVGGFFIEDKVNFKVTADLIANYIGISGALSVGFAGAWVAIKISENTARLQEEANRMGIMAYQVKVSDDYERYFNDSLKVYRRLAVAIASLSKSSIDLEIAYQRYIESAICMKWFESPKAAKEALSEQLISSTKNYIDDSDYNRGVERYRMALEEIIAILTIIIEDDQLHKQWQASYTGPLTPWPSILKDPQGEYHLRPAGANAVELQYDDIVSVKNYLNYHSRNLTQQTISLSLKPTVRESLGEPVSTNEGDFGYFPTYDPHFSYPSDIEGIKLAGKILTEEQEYYRLKGTKTIVYRDPETQNLVTDNNYPDEECKRIYEAIELFLYLIHSMPDGEIIRDSVIEYMTRKKYSLDTVDTNFGIEFNAINYLSTSEKRFEEEVEYMQAGKHLG